MNSTAGNSSVRSTRKRKHKNKHLTTRKLLQD